MRGKHYAFLILTGLMVMPAMSNAQFPGMGGGGFDPSKMDPDFIFNMIS